jgi:hypothetical protein
MPPNRDGFQPCAIDVEGGACSLAMPRWERNLVVFALIVHVLDIVLDLLVLSLFVTYGSSEFALESSSVILWAWLVSSLYISFGGSQANIQSDGIDSPRGSDPCNRCQSFCCSFAQVQIFKEAHRCIYQNGDTDYFHTLRLMEAILESAPSSVVQLYALISWAGDAELPPSALLTIKASVAMSFLSVGLGLAMWEQKVQFQTGGWYIACVAVMRSLEIASRSLTLALFSSLAAPQGFWWAIAVDYGAMVLLILKHQSVQFTYGLFLALPLVCVSLEPLVWRRDDHAVPKDYYYALRVFEFVVMWIYIISQQGSTKFDDISMNEWTGSQVLALLSTLGLYLMFPCIYRTARQHELSRDVIDWNEDGGDDSLMRGEELYSNDDSDSDDSAKEGLLRDDDEAAAE